MHADKTNKKPLSPIQKKATPISKNHEKYNDSENMLGYCFNHADENNTLSKTLQLRATAFHYNMNVLQLANKYGEKAKLRTKSLGCNPVSAPNKLGVTCHHIIPNTSLEIFYEICNSYASMDQDIAVLFEEWKRTALNSAENSKRFRSVSQETLDDKQLLTYAGCMWMCGNIFIGPSSTNRVDDPGNSFDYGAYTSNSNEPYATDDNQRNQQVKTLESIKKTLERLVHSYSSESSAQSSAAPWNKQLPVNEDDKEDIINVLRVLIPIAASPLPINTESSHEGYPPESSQTELESPAYQMREWISVGKIPINKMRNERILFSAMHEKYMTLYTQRKAGSRLTPIEFDFYSYCYRHFKEAGLKLDISGNKEWVIAKYIFLIVKQKYEACCRQNSLVLWTPPVTDFLN